MRGWDRNTASLGAFTHTDPCGAFHDRGEPIVRAVGPADGQIRHNVTAERSVYLQAQRPFR